MGCHSSAGKAEIAMNLLGKLWPFQYNYRLGTTGREFSMGVVVLAALLIMTGCSSMLLGNGSSNDSSPSTSTGATAASEEDAAISAVIRQAFSDDQELRRFNIGVRTVNRRVTLTGTVGSYAARDSAIGIARKTRGVDNVSNRLVVNTNRE
jgi:hyperosmotically inducible protein